MQQNGANPCPSPVPVVDGVAVTYDHDGLDEHRLAQGEELSDALLDYPTLVVLNNHLVKSSKVEFKQGRVESIVDDRPNAGGREEMHVMSCHGLDWLLNEGKPFTYLAFLVIYFLAGRNYIPSWLTSATCRPCVERASDSTYRPTARGASPSGQH